ncbi:MAG TPA: glycosyltransferase family 4 protein [Candidatus Omnitrophota bacterium]|nr:glycosyltransferase family 4 protein [Candidatus Omnitrophota bacterium]
MKITFVLPGIFIAGGVRAVFECSNRLIERGHEVSIVHPAAPLETHARYSFKRTLRQASKFASNSINPNRADWFDLKARLFRVPCLYAELVPLFARMIPDADLVVATTWESSLAVARLSESKGKKAYFIQHYEVTDIWDSDECWKQAEAQDPDLSRIFITMAGIEPKNAGLAALKAKVDRSFSLPQAKFTTSTVLSDMVTVAFKQKIFGKVPIGNNFDLFYPEGKKAEENLILMPFRGLGWKGGLDGLQALEAVRKERSDIKVIMFGPDYYGKYIPSWVDFRSRVSDAELRRLYSTADIFVSPTWVEGWGSPPMEAMACRTACITTNVGAVPDYADNGRTALVVPPKDPPKMAAAILELLNDRSKREKMTLAGFESIKKFTWDRTVDEMEAIFKRIMSD